MWDKSKKGFKSIVKYLRELSIVVAGIAITFTLNDWISNKNEKKELQRYLEAVKLELEDNMKIVHDQFVFYDRTGKFAKYLMSDKLENLQADSLVKYDHVRGYITYMIYKTSSFEMLKFSGTMRLIKNKELLKSIIDCYNLMELSKNTGDKYMNTKWDELYHTLISTGILGSDYDIREPEFRRLFNFFAIDTNGEEPFKDSEQQIKKTLSMF